MGLGELITVGVFALLGIVAFVLRKKLAENKALEALWVAIHNTEDEFVKLAKEADADGKLDAEEIKKAKQMAIDKALAYAKGPALQVLKDWGLPKLEAIITNLVQKKKDA